MRLSHDRIEIIVRVLDSPRIHLDDHRGSHVSGGQLVHSPEYTLPENDHSTYPREAIPHL